jgi:hypothetical protein
VRERRGENFNNLSDSTKSQNPDTDWKCFFNLMSTIEVPSEYMAKRPMNRLPRDRTLFSSADPIDEQTADSSLRSE